MKKDTIYLRGLEILETLSANPSVPYFENAVSTTIQNILKENKIAYKIDEYGNIIAQYTPKESESYPVALVSHMDHPGIEITNIQERDVSGILLGRSSDALLTSKIPLLIHDATGKVIRCSTTGNDPVLNNKEISIRLEENITVKLPAFAVFDLVNYKKAKGKIHMRACDDLVGCATSLAILEYVATNKLPISIYSIFTRAEEEGLIGARLIAKKKVIPTDTLIISVETSKAIPGGELGKGPIIRVGDAATTFSAEAESLFTIARNKLSKNTSPLSIQRQLMDKGVCEASAFVLNGYKVTGIAFPLGHYHNGLNEPAVKAEFISENDFKGGLLLLLEAIQSTKIEVSNLFQGLRSNPLEPSKRLQETINPTTL